MGPQIKSWRQERGSWGAAARFGARDPPVVHGQAAERALPAQTLPRLCELSFLGAEQLHRPIQAADEDLGKESGQGAPLLQPVAPNPSAAAPGPSPRTRRDPPSTWRRRPHPGAAPRPPRNWWLVSAAGSPLGKRREMVTAGGSGGNGTRHPPPSRPPPRYLSGCQSRIQPTRDSTAQKTPSCPGNALYPLRLASSCVSGWAGVC